MSNRLTFEFAVTVRKSIIRELQASRRELLVQLAALRNSREVLLHPGCTQIRGFSVLGVELLYWRQRRRVLLGGRRVEPSDSECYSGTDKDDIMISYGKRRRRGPVCRTKYRERR